MNNEDRINKLENKVNIKTNLDLLVNNLIEKEDIKNNEDKNNKEINEKIH